MSTKRPEGVKRDEPFGPGYEKTEDEVMLLERADFAHRFLSNPSHLGEVDPMEMLAAVVWPTKEMLQAQRNRSRG